jgi:hypothetical protein
MTSPTRPAPTPSKAVKDGALASQLQYFRSAVFQLPAAKQIYWTEVWEATVADSFNKVQANRKWFYSLQGTSAAAALVVPALVGLNLSGTGGVAVRWVTFVIGLIGALTGAALTLFRFGSRWRLYRDFYSELLQAGREYILLGAPPDGWTGFQQRVDGYMAAYDRAYDAEVITAVQPTTTAKADLPKDTGSDGAS